MPPKQKFTFNGDSQNVALIGRLDVTKYSRQLSAFIALGGISDISE